MNEKSRYKSYRGLGSARKLSVVGLAAIAIAAGAAMLLNWSASSTTDVGINRTVDVIFGILSARAQQSGVKVKVTKEKLRDFLKKSTSLENLLKKHGHARVIVKYKRKAPKIGPPGLATRAWYQGWKFVGMPAAAPPRALGRTKFVRKDVTRDELKTLRGNPEIDHVFADIPIPPALAESGPLVRSDMSKLLTQSKRPDRQTHAVVILDTGVEVEHPFLAGAVLNELSACFSTEQLRPPFQSVSLCPNGAEEVREAGAAKPCDASMVNCDHGTHVAGIVAGWSGTANGKTFHGVGPEVPVIPVQIYSKITAKEICQIYGFDAPCILSFISNQVEALEYARELNQRGIPIGAVNLSLAAGNFGDACDSDDSAKLVADKINELAQAKIPVVIAAGNGGSLTGVGTPGCVQNAVTVAATNDSGGLAINFPSGGGTNYSKLVDLTAPGVNVVSSVPGKQFKTKSGTSMAAPHVAAALARVRAVRATASVQDLIGVLGNFSTNDVVHPTDGNLKRPVTVFSDQLIARLLVAGSATASGLVAPAATRRLTRVDSKELAKQLLTRSNRLIVDYGAESSAADQERIVNLLKSRGISVVQSQNKTSRLGVIVTEKPISASVLESLKREAGVKGLYRDIPLPPPK